MKQETVDIPVRVDGKDADKLWRMTKKELINKMCSLAVEAELYKNRAQVAIEDAQKWECENNRLENKIQYMSKQLDMAESYVDQGRAMVGAIMERWDDYSV